MIGHATWGVTSATMPRPFHQIRAAVGAGIPLRIGNKLTRRCKQALPIRHRPTHAHDPRHGRGLIGLLHRFHFVHEKRIHRFHVFIGHDGIRWIRHGGVQRRAIITHTVFHRIGKLCQAVFAYARFRVWGDVGGVNRAHRRLHRQTTCVCLATRHAVTGKAI